MPKPQTPTCRPANRLRLRRHAMESIGGDRRVAAIATEKSNFPAKAFHPTRVPIEAGDGIYQSAAATISEKRVMDVR